MKYEENEQIIKLDGPEEEEENPDIQDESERE